MADIFISYSSKDKEKADQLSELLVSAGLSVWIDQSGIAVATSWSGEIVQAINDCKAFVVLLSTSSLESHNVIKEVSLASEKCKKILPLDLEPVQLTKDFEYHLAGIQRAPMANIDAIIRALGRLGLQATQAPMLKLVKETDARKSLMILPFEDLSPSGDNQWFADGIVAELIGALSHVKSLRVTDPQTTKEFSSYKGHLTVYAHEMSVRYFVQGSVRKMGDQLKIMAHVLDIESGDYLWQDSLKGTMGDIFDIQETVAKKVVEGLNIILTKEEVSKLDERGTENAEAYEYYLRAWELYSTATRDGCLQAISLCDLAIKLDPHFADAVLRKAIVNLVLYKNYEGDSMLLRDAEVLLQRVEVLKPGGWQVHSQLADIYLVEGRAAEAEREHQAHLVRDDGSVFSLAGLGYFCFMTKQYSKAFEYYERALSIDSINHLMLWNVIVNAQKASNTEGLIRWSDHAIPTFQKQLRLHPEDASARYHLAAAYFWTSHRDESLQEVDLLESLPNLDSFIQYRLATLLVEQNEDDRAIESLRKAIDKQFANLERSRESDSPFTPLFGNSKFEAVMKEAEAKANV